MRIAHSGSGTRPRDARLDAARGLALLIILVAHIPSNPWASWIPARFGYSDATEMFVFCSGLASALAFGRVFDEAGFAAGSARIARRIWQVYWVHVGAFLVTVALLALAGEILGTDRYLRNDLNLGPFLDDPGRRVLGLLTLTYVPNYFDILPMYLVVLALVPVVLAAERVGPAAVAALAGGLWVLSALRLLELPADPALGRPWFFNPFSWQLLFFLGFGLGRGWIAPPRCRRSLIAIALMIVLPAVPVSCHYGFACHAAWGTLPWLGDVHRALLPLTEKTHLGVLRIGHFLSLAYLAYVALGARTEILEGPLGRVLRLLGRQSLAVFAVGLVAAQGLGVVLDLTGRSAGSVALANLGGAVLLTCVAWVVERLKGRPESARSPVPKARTLVAAGVPSGR